MGTLRLLAAVLFLALSLWVVVPAPSLFLWIVTLGVTEWGHWLALATLILLACEVAWGSGRIKYVTISTCVLAAIFFSWPVIQSIPIAGRLPAELRDAFGSPSHLSNPASIPFRFSTLWWRASPRDVKKQTFHYLAEDGTSLALDYFSNSSPGNRPCIVVVHGGAWHSGSVQELEA